MANEKPTNARLQMKHDIEANWIIAGNATNPFVPKPGELIIYDVDDSHDSPRIKIGDGDNNVNELPFFVDETKADKTEVDIKLATKIDRSEIEEEDAVTIATELNLVSPVAADDGSIYTDENGDIYTL